MRSKDLKNIKEAPGDVKTNKSGNLRGMRSTSSQYRKQSDPDFDRVAQQNNQFRSTPPSPKNVMGDRRGMEPGSRRTQFRKDTDPEFDRVAQSNNQFRSTPPSPKNKSGDRRGMEPGSRNQQYRKKGDPEFDRIAQQNRQFRAGTGGGSGGSGGSGGGGGNSGGGGGNDDFGMNPLGDPGKKNQAGQDTRFKRADQRINNKFDNQDDLAGGSSRLQQYKRDKEQKARMQKSKTKGDIGRFADERAIFKPGKIIQHPSGFYYQLQNDKSYVEVDGVTTNKKTGEITGTPKPAEGGFTVKPNSRLGKQLVTLTKDPKAKVDQSVMDKIKGAAKGALQKGLDATGMDNLAAKTRSDPDASTAKKAGATIGAGIGRAMSNVLRKRPGQQAPAKKPMVPVAQVDMKAFQYRIMKSQDPAEKLQLATQMLDSLAVSKSRNIDISKYLDSLGPMLKSSGLQKTNPQEYAQLVTKARSMREAAFNYFNKLIETVGITWEQLGYKVVLSENKGDDIILIPTKDIELQQLKALAGV